MEVLMRAVLFAFLIGGVGVLSGCFAPDEPACAFACGSGEMCPDNYLCQADGYCHKKGSTVACNYPDAAVKDASVPDLRSLPDLLGTD